MAGPEWKNDQENPVFLVVGPEDWRSDSESAWHRKLLHSWLPIIRQLGPVVVLDRPESRLAFHAHVARGEGKKPVSIQFLPVHRIYPVEGVQTVAATACDHVSAPDWAVGGDVRRRWSRTVPHIDILLTTVPATEDAFRDAGFRGRAWVVPGLDRMEQVPAEPRSRAEGVEVPFGWTRATLPEPAWQETDAGARGLSSQVWFGIRRGYYRFARPWIPVGIHQAFMRKFQEIKKNLSRCKSSMSGHRVVLDPQGAEVTVARLDPLSDPMGVTECLLAFRRALGDQADRVLVAEVPGRFEESVKALAELASRMTRCRARLLAVAEGTDEAWALRRMAAWALAPGADRGSMEWAETMLGLGVPLMAPGRGLSAPVGAAWPGIALAGARVPSRLADDPDGLMSLLALRARHDEIERALLRTISVHSGSKAHSALREMALEGSRGASAGFAREVLEMALSINSAGMACLKAA